MIPDFDKINERMEQASLKEFMPGFDKEQEWLQLSQQLHPLKKNKIIPIWSYAAAVLLLLAGGCWLAWFLSGTHKTPSIVITTPIKPMKSILPITDTANTVKPIAPQTDTSGINKNVVAIRKHIPPHKAYTLKHYKTENVICNGTPCPIQICISQTMQCPHTNPADISSCSTLEPNQSTSISYKAHDKIAKNCSLTINQIEIKSIATGETILLNASSSPSTAQEVFSYITGQKKGDILAGMFNSDCNHQTHKHDLRLNNSYGDLMIQ